MKMIVENDAIDIHLKSVSCSLYKSNSPIETSPMAVPQAEMHTKIFLPARSTKTIVTKLANNWTEATIIEAVLDGKVDPASSKILFV